MRKTLWCASLIVTGVAAGAGALHATAQPGGQGHTPPFGLHGPRGRSGQCEVAGAFHALMQQMHSELDLTEAQREAVHEVFRARRGELATAIRPVLQAKRAIVDAVHADAPDETAIRAAADSLGRSVGDAAVVIARVKGEVFQAAALTPEQTRKLGEIRTRVDASMGRMLDMLQAHAENPR